MSYQTTTDVNGEYTITVPTAVFKVTFSKAGYQDVVFNGVDLSVEGNYTLNATLTPILVEYSLTITSTTGGTTQPPPGSYVYPEGAIAQITAIPDIGYALDHWKLDGVNIGSSNPVNITMDADHTLQAVFIPVGVDMATIEGVVLDEDAQPIAEATVVTEIYSTLTDINGNYSLLVPVRPEPYSLVVRKAGFTQELATVLASQVGTIVQNFVLTVAKCFIATAAYGTPLAPQLTVLRRFRDLCLPETVVQLYYWLSPPMAKYIRRRCNIRRIVRQLLEPLIKGVKRLV